MSLIRQKLYDTVVVFGKSNSRLFFSLLPFFRSVKYQNACCSVTDFVVGTLWVMLASLSLLDIFLVCKLVRLHSELSGYHYGWSFFNLTALELNDDRIS